MNEILVTVDLGTINAFEVVKDSAKLENHSLKKIKSEIMNEPRAKAADKYSDSAGRFYQGGGNTGGTSAGISEQHNAGLEIEKRQIRRIADTINKLVVQRDCDKWYLAADRSINNQLLQELAPAVKAKLERNVAANLTKSPKLDVLGQFFERMKKAA